MGDAVNVASRLSDLTGADQIWINDAAITGAHESDGVRFRQLGPSPYAGAPSPATSTSGVARRRSQRLPDHAGAMWTPPCTPS